MSYAEPDQQRRGRRPATRRQRRRVAIVMIVVALVCIALLTWGVVRALGVGSPPVKDGKAAALACEGFIRDQLKAPRSAKFTAVAWAGSSPRWTVTGKLDADNSFGGTARSDWTCTVRINGDGWTLESLTGLN